MEQVEQVGDPRGGRGFIAGWIQTEKSQCGGDSSEVIQLAWIQTVEKSLGGIRRILPKDPKRYIVYTLVKSKI